MRERLTFANKEKYRQKLGKIYLFICISFYISCCAVKGIFAAETRYIIEIWKLTQSQVQLANTFYFITYGTVQILLFIFMEKIDIKKYTYIMISLSALTFIIMGLATNIETMWILFGFVGIFQSSMFCATNYLLTKNLPSNLLPVANKWIAAGYAIGTAFSYIVAAIFVGLELWRLPYFFMSGLVLFLTMSLIYSTKVISRFNKINQKLDTKQILTESKECVRKENPLPQTINKPIIMLSTKRRKIMFYALILLTSLIINGLYYGVFSFVTSVLVDIYNFPQDASIYVSTIIPILIILGPVIIINSCEKHRDFIKVGIKYLLIFLIIPILLGLFYDVNAILFIALIVVYLVLVNGIRVILNNVIAFKMKDYINVASFTALTNAFASIAASVWPLIIAFIYDNSNWGVTYWTLTAMTAILLVITIIIEKVVKTTYKKDNNGENLE